MATTRRVSIRKQEKRLILFLLYYTLFIQGLMSLLNLPQIALYVKDAVLAVCIILDLYRHKFSIKKTGTLQILSVTLFVICAVSAVAGNVSTFTYLVAVRKFFRGFVYMALCIEYLDASDIDNVIHFCYKLQWVNFLLIAIQRFGLGFDQDHSNGIFGTGLTNNYTSVLCIILVCYCTAEFYYKKCPLKKWVAQLIVNFAIAAAAELKVLFLLLPVAIIFILREKLFSQRGMNISFFLILGVAGALVVFGTMYPDQLNVLITFSGMKNYNNWGLATHSLVDRKNWLQYTVTNIFDGNIVKNLIGVGFGTVSGLSSSVADAYGYRELGYGSYTASMLFLELGFSGLILIVFWFVTNFNKAFQKFSDGMLQMFADFEKGFILSMIVFLVYANILFNDSSYLVFFALSFMYVKNKAAIER